MSLRELIIKKVFEPAEVETKARDLINTYHFNKEVYDEDYDTHPLYALLKIMVHAKRCAFIIARKNITSFPIGDSARSNYIVYKAYMEEYQTAYNELAKYMKDEELDSRLEDVKAKLVDSIAVKYDDNLSLMMDIFDTDSPLYGIEGIGYAR